MQQPINHFYHNNCFNRNMSSYAPGYTGGSTSGSGRHSSRQTRDRTDDPFNFREVGPEPSGRSSRRLSGSDSSHNVRYEVRQVVHQTVEITSNGPSQGSHGTLLRNIAGAVRSRNPPSSSGGLFSSRSSKRPSTASDAGYSLRSRGLGIDQIGTKPLLDPFGGSLLSGGSRGGSNTGRSQTSYASSGGEGNFTTEERRPEPSVISTGRSNTFNIGSSQSQASYAPPPRSKTFTTEERRPEPSKVGNPYFTKASTQYSTGSRSTARVASPPPTQRTSSRYTTESRGRESSRSTQVPQSSYKSSYQTKESRPSQSKSTRSQSYAASTVRGTTTSSGAMYTLSQISDLFDSYNARWSAIGRSDSEYPLPASQSELTAMNFIETSSSSGGYSAEDIFIANVQLFFLIGNGVPGVMSKGETLKVKLNPTVDKKKLKVLVKWLKLKEQPRWHPDRMNLRTGVDGAINEQISKNWDVVAMRTAVQGLIEKIEKSL